MTPNYSCRYLGPGTGSAGPLLTPMLNAWGAAKGHSFFPGTLNLCASTPVELPEDFESLSAVGDLVQPAWRQSQNGFSLRLYPVLLNSTEAAWIFRWSSPEFLHYFVGHANNCDPENRCEIVGESQLTAVLGLKPGDVVSLQVLSRRT